MQIAHKSTLISLVRCVTLPGHVRNWDENKWGEGEHDTESKNETKTPRSDE